MIPVKKTARLACLLFLLFSAPLAAADGLSVTDIKGKTHSPFNDKSVKGVALIFITTDCPVANYFQPTIRRIGDAAKEKGIRVYLVHSDPDTTTKAASKHASEYGISAPVILDHDQNLARKHGAKWTPEAVLIAPDGTITYRGRIDNTYADYGKKRPKPTKEDLKDAIDNLLAGQRTKKPVTTKPVGCPIYFLKEKPGK